MFRALIIGHGGQDGRILWDQLALRGFCLLGVARRGIRTHATRWSKDIVITSLLDMQEVMATFNPDQIYYLAAHHYSSQDSGSADASAWQESWDVHVHAFSNVLRAAKDCCPNARIFYASSSRVFGEAAASPQDEKTPLRPTCIYGVTKASAMLLADYFRRVHNMYVSSGILFNHESPLRGAQFVSQRVVDGLVAIKYGSASSLEIGSLEARVDWGYAPDYTRAMQMILEADQAGDFVIASGETHSIRELIVIVADYLRLPWEHHVIETSRILQRKPQDLCGDSSRLRRVTGWKPSVDFKGMIHILIEAAIARHQRTNGTTL